MIGRTVSRYRILSKLGSGGMGVVYEAEDTELGRRVAVKFLPEAAVRSADALDRFKREARAASALNHPHICTVFDVGVHEGKPFLVMERMQGRTLKHTIEGQPLSIGQVVSLGEQIADALDAAHHAGIVHRDLKPANLFVTERGEAKVLDFGLAKMASPEHGGAPDAVTVAMEYVTSAGTTLGTVAYMSPEQARGEPVDARSDLFSLGIVLYEMATGRLPFQGGSAAEFFAAILKADPMPPSQLNLAIPSPLEQVMLKLLEKDPALRYQSAADVRVDLKRVLRDSHARVSDRADVAVQMSGAAKASGSARSRVGTAIGLAAVLVAVIAGGLWLTKSRAGGAGSTIRAVSTSVKRIAVLPFENIGAAEDTYFADGMTDEVRSKLSGLPGLAVIARTSSNQYKATTKTPGEVASELDVGYLLSATVRWQKTGATSRIRLLPELVEIGDGVPTTRWQQAFDADLADVFEVQGRIATQVAEALQMTLGATLAMRLDDRPTSNLAAYDAYLRGREIFDRSFDPAIQRQAALQFEQAVALDPKFAQGWARLSLARSMTYGNGLPSPELGDAARAAAEKAFALAPTLAEPHFALGVFERMVSRDRARAVEVLRRGLQIAPDNVDLLRNLGYAEQERGRLEEAFEAVRWAVSLDPRSWANQLSLVDILKRLHRPREAREAADRGLALNPTQLDLIRDKADTYLQEGDLAGARAVVASVPKEVEATALVAHFALYNQSWVLSSAQRDLLLRLTRGAFDDNGAHWAEFLATEHSLRGNVAEAQKYAEEARRNYVEQLEKAGDDADLVSSLGYVLALLGQGKDAVRNGERAVTLAPIEKEASDIGGSALKYLALIHTRLGNQESAIDALERLLKAPYRFTPGWLRVDPNFDRLRGNPRFDRLARGQE